MNLEFFDRFPLLATDRLELRQLEPRDAPAIFDLFSHPEVVQHYDIGALTDGQAASTLIGRMIHRYQSRSGIRWAIVLRDRQEVIGTVGLNTILAHARRADVGYDLVRSFWGQGIATEALQRVVSFGLNDVGLQRIEAAVMTENAASVRVLEKCGFVEEGLLRSYGYWKGQAHDLRMFSLLPSQ